MPVMTPPEPHTLTIPPDLFARIVEAAQARGQDPDNFALAALTATVVEPVWKTRLRQSQATMQEAFEDSGMTEEEIGADIDAEIKAYRAERREQETPEG
jgi:hypothetical protein